MLRSACDLAGSVEAQIASRRQEEGAKAAYSVLIGLSKAARMPNPCCCLLEACSQQQ